MTLVELLAVLRRRWYVPLIGLVCLAVSLVGARESRDVFFSEAAVVFEAPGVPVVSGVNSGYSESLTHFAALVERTVNDGEESIRLSSPTATLFGIGIRKGRSVVLADRGGQWTHVFDRPVLQIQVVDSSPDAVAELMAATVAKIAATAASLQSASGAPPESWIRVTVNKEQSQIVAFGQTTEGRAKGAAALGVATFGIFSVLAYALDRRIERRSVVSTNQVPPCF